MLYLHVYLPDDTVEYYCSKHLHLLVELVSHVTNEWTIGNFPTEFPAEDYLEFEILAIEDCKPLGKVN